jgi:hypothetical protein
MTKRRRLSPAGLASAVRHGVSRPGARRPVVQVRVYDGKGHAQTLDPHEGRGSELREAAEALLKAVE